MPIKDRILRILVTARSEKKWLSAKDLAKNPRIRSLGTIWRNLQRFHAEGIVARRRIQPPKGRWYYVYQATEAGLARLELGGPPRGVENPESFDIEVLVTTLQDVLDTNRIKFEDRQVVIALDPFVTKVLRSACSPQRTRKGKKRDRANQVTYASESFVITIPHTGNAVLVMKDWLNWDKSFSDWMQRAGLSTTSIRQILKQVWNQIPGGTTRAEIPVLEQMIKRLAVECSVKTLVDGKIAVQSEINYSLNEIGLEYFGGTRWVDALIRVLIAFQHSTVVSEVARDQWLDQVFEALEQQRKEREAREEAEKQERESKDDRRPDYYV